MTRLSFEKEDATHGAGDVSTDVSLGPAHDGVGHGNGSGSGMDYEDDGLGLRNRFESHQQQHLQVDQDALALERINTYRLQQQETVGSAHTHRTRTPRDHWVPIGAGKPFPPTLDQEQYVVEFNGSDDPMHPQNWPTKQRIFLGSLLTFCALMTSFESAVFPVTVPFVTKEYGFGREVGALGTTLYVLGFSAGPVLWAPTSELYGRRWLLVLGFFGFSIFTISCAVAKDTQTLLICRFFAGLFAASPVTLVPASLSDLFNNMHRGIAIASYTLAMFIGPYTAPFVAGYIADSYLGWRFVFYIPSFVSFFNTVLLLLFARETYAPVVLVHKAALIRRQTLNWGVHARQEAIEVDFKAMITKNLARPFRILFTEPIAFLVTVYMSFIYGLAYALLEAYPVVFQGVYGFTGGNSGLPFIGLIVGLGIAAVFVGSFQGSYVRKLQANNNVPVPEWRLPPCIVGGLAFSGGLFWFGWTGFTPSIHWIVPTIAGGLVGFGIITIFMQCFNYLLDTYLQFAASAFAANTMMRSCVGAVFPLFATQMFENLGVQWAGTLLGCIAALLVPIPLAFLLWGKTLRRKSRLAPTDDGETGHVV